MYNYIKGGFSMPEILSRLSYFMQFVRIMDIIDILIVAYFIYKGITLLRETRAATLVKGIVILIVAMQLSSLFKLYLVNYILRNAMQVGFIALIVMFQPEMRRGLEKVGRSKFGNLFSIYGPDREEEDSKTIIEICRAIDNLSSNRVGALIIFEKETALSDIMESGTVIDAEISEQLLGNIFYEGSPLHDGAVII